MLSRRSVVKRPARSRVLRLSSLGLVAIAALITTSACTSRAGAAAVVGDDRIEISTLHDMVVRGTNTTSLQTFQNVDGLQRRELTLLVRRDLIASLAKQMNVSVSPQQVGKVAQNFANQAGGQKAFEQQAAQSGVGARDLPAILRDEALGEAITAKLSSDPTNGDALYAQALQREAKRIGVHISPRFGQWDQSTVAVVPTTDNLSTPPKTGSDSSSTSDLGQ
jgi:hypothetical protein